MRVFHQKSAERGKEYYAASDYYDGGPDQLKGQWFGIGAELLGLNGDIDKTHFDRMVDNLHPFENKLLTQRYRKDRRVLTDITFSAPKSVSILFGVTEDYAIADAVRESALETFGDLEHDVQTRVNHSRGKLTYEPTHNLVGGLWLHLTGRPEDHPELGSHPDMQLHCHGAILNATNVDDDRWTAIDLSNVVRDSGYYDALFMSRLATKIKDLGYDVERSQYNFEVAGISREMIEKFSRRTAKINELVKSGVAEKIAQHENISIKDAKDKLGAFSRKEKNSEYSIQELPKIWRQRLSDPESHQIEKVVRGDPPTKKNIQTASQAVDYAAEHNFERRSVIRERHLLRDALLNGIGDVSAESIHKEVGGRYWISEGQGASSLITTREILKEEQALLSFARKGRGSMKPLASEHTIEREWLSDEQKHAVKGLLKSTDRVQILRGVAGAGKTTLMSEAIEGIEKASTAVSVLAPTAEAAYDVLSEQEGFSAHTLAAFLLDKNVQAEARGGVIWVDEAGQAGCRTSTSSPRSQRNWMPESYLVVINGNTNLLLVDRH